MEHAVHKSEILQDMHKDLFPLYFYHFFFNRRASALFQQQSHGKLLNRNLRAGVTRV